ncbi:hypothetical protein Tdes44962_MAKER01228 [Teratosphaeria destructans]|uniref:Uncharacterized protein n=1 Tax=Teratosphaeria destructans TaxID=418781 RepID=A0A9W7T0Y2_9PEZI|nr:hypothetical protein Tdes44962_MAKER01228 [Teratosphaeria destructans]
MDRTRTAEKSTQDWFRYPSSAKSCGKVCAANSISPRYVRCSADSVGTYAVPGSEVEDARVLRGSEGLEEMSLEEGLEVLEGPEPLVRGSGPVGSGISLVPECGAAQGVTCLVLRRHDG